MVKQTDMYHKNHSALSNFNKSTEDVSCYTNGYNGCLAQIIKTDRQFYSQ